MKNKGLRGIVAILLAALIVTGIGCYPVYPPQGGSAYSQDSKGYSVPMEPAPQPQRYGVDPGLVVAGVAAAGLLGYAIANDGNRGSRYYYGPPAYYRPVPYGRAYYGRRYHP